MSYFDDNEDFIVNKLPHGCVQKKQKKRPIFTRGYDVCRERLSSNPYYTRSCFNCAFYYQAVGDKEEVCQNDDVLEYDMVVDGNNIYCLKWKPNAAKVTEQKAMFKKGRSRLD